MPKGGKIEGGRWGWLGGGKWWGENGDNYTLTQISRTTKDNNASKLQ